MSSAATVQPDFASSRREMGQVVTPVLVARWMAQWVMEANPRLILDPALGPGVFAMAAAEVVAARRQHRHKQGRPFVPARLDGFEIDRTIAVPKPGKRLINLRVRHEDFLGARLKPCYDAILANPPYIRHHDMGYGEKDFAPFDKLCGGRISRKTNLYGLFLLRIWSLLAAGGRAAVITPAEWLNADFGVFLKRYLLAQNAIDGVIHFDRAARIFEGALTTACIVLLRRGRKADESIRLIPIATVNELGHVRLDSGAVIARDRISANAKWTPLFEGPAVVSPSRWRLGDIASCSRGIATGANDYFTMCESKRRRLGIDLRDVVPCITRARQITGDRLTIRGLNDLKAADEPIFLLRPRPKLTSSVAKFLEQGRRQRISRRYLPMHRPVWYRPEVRRAAPILAPVFSRGDFRFVLNEADVLTLTAYHGIYLHDPARKKVARLFEYLNSPAAQAALQRHRRIYGGGLLKVEPRDVEALEIPGDVYEACRPRCPDKPRKGQ